MFFLLEKGGNIRLRRGVWRQGCLDVRGVVTALGGGTLAAVWGGDVIVLQVWVWSTQALKGVSVLATETCILRVLDCCVLYVCVGGAAAGCFTIP